MLISLSFFLSLQAAEVPYVPTNYVKLIYKQMHVNHILNQSLQERNNNNNNNNNNNTNNNTNDSKIGKNPLKLLALQLIPLLSTICIHKLGGQIILKLINQHHDKEAQDTILSGLVADTTLYTLLADTTRGFQFFQKVISSPYLSTSEQQVLCARARTILLSNESTNDPTVLAAHKAFLDELNVVVQA